jgi:hypothetical protein
MRELVKNCYVVPLASADEAWGTDPVRDAALDEFRAAIRRKVESEKRSVVCRMLNALIDWLHNLCH